MNTSLAKSPQPAKPSCDQVIQACDKALDDEGKEIDADKLLILDLGNANRDLMLRSEDAESELDAWYRNPWMLLSIGFIIGGLGGIYAAHH